MQINNLQADSVDQFFQSIESGSPLPEQQTPPDNITNVQNSLENSVLENTEGNSLDNFINSLDKETKEKEQEVKKEDNLTSLVSLFQEKEVLGVYEDGTVPQTTDELVDAIKQSSLLIAQQQAQEYIKQEIESLPTTIQQIIDYGKGGITTASELKQFINSVSNYEQISQLDPSNEDHQEAIVRMQLINSGFDEATANEQIEIYKETNKLATTAEKLIVPLKETYRKEYQQHLIEKQEKENFLSSQIDTNSVNVRHYLDKEIDYLPFKLEDNKVKAGVYDLGAQVYEWDDKGNPVFGWQKKMESLQYSANPDEFKTFVKILAFMNDPAFYEKKLGKVVSNATVEKEYKQVKQIVSKSVIPSSSEQSRNISYQRADGPLSWQ